MSFGLLCSFYALKYGDVSIVAPITNTEPLFILLFTHLFLKKLEKVSILLLMGTVMIVTGISQPGSDSWATRRYPDLISPGPAVMVPTVNETLSLGNKKEEPDPAIIKAIIKNLKKFLYRIPTPPF